MSRGHKKTREFKDRQCRYCELADARALRKGQPCCPLPNPRIRNGHCIDRKPIKRKKRSKVKEATNG